MNNEKKYFDTNRQNWNKRTDIHFNSQFYDVKNFLNSKNSLNDIELIELGDLKGKKLLHLQCHFGLDTLSLANMGAKVTGIDFSENAITKANELKEIMNLNAQFICCNVYDIKEHLHEKFDVIFTSYGTIGWLPHINKWAEIISYFLRSGGKFLIVEFHPYIWMFDDKFEKIKYSYFHEISPIVETVENTYTDGDEKINMTQYSWNHTISDVISALISKGLIINSFLEYNYSPYN